MAKQKKNFKPENVRFKSEAHRQKMIQLYEQGKIKKEVLERWDQQTPKVRLPVKLPKKPTVKS